MSQFKNAFSQLLRLHPKYREQLRRRAVITPAATTTGTHTKCKAVRKRAHLEPEFAVWHVRHSTDTVSTNVEEVEEYEGEDDGKCDNGQGKYNSDSPATI